MDRQAFVHPLEADRLNKDTALAGGDIASGQTEYPATANVLKAMGELGVPLTDQIYSATAEPNSVLAHGSPLLERDVKGEFAGRDSGSSGSFLDFESDCNYTSPNANDPGALYRCAKRAIDIVGSLLGLVVLLPVIITISILVAIDSGVPIFHRRRVLSSHAYDAATPPRTFDAFKFRTMVRNADSVLQNDPALYREYTREFKLRDDPRVTRIGHQLRRMSLDEIPQFVNVLRGQMTLVGPRMISPPELSMYGQNAALLLTVKPGITGLWQVSGRQTVSYAERVRLDLSYIENRSTLLDLQILVRTIVTVLARRGAF